MKKSVVLSLLLAFIISACATAGREANSTASRKTTLFLESNHYSQKLKLYGITEFIGAVHSTSTKTTLLLERPSKVRLSFISPIGATLLLAVSDGENFSIVIPSAGINDTRELKGNDVIKIGGVGFPMEDFIRFILPSLEKGWLNDGKVRVTGNRMQVKRKEGEYDFLFYGSGKMKSVAVQKRGLPKFNVEYFYRAGHRIEVLVNGVIRFKFASIKTVKRFKWSSFTHNK